MTEKERLDMAIHLRLLANALENPELSTVKVDWASIRNMASSIINFIDEECNGK